MSQARRHAHGSSVRYCRQCIENVCSEFVGADRKKIGRCPTCRTFLRKAAGGGVELTLVKTLESRACNVLYWSPAGGMLLLATLGESSGALEFYDADHDVSKVEEHYKMTHIEWDPSGRTLCTAVCQPIEGAFFKFQMDNGFKLWTFQGACYHEASYENFYQLAWRPRPKSQVLHDCPGSAEGRVA